MYIMIMHVHKYIIIHLQSLALWLIHLEHRKGVHTSGVQLVFWSVILLSSVIATRSYFLQPHSEVRYVFVNKKKKIVYMTQVTN